MPGLYGERLRRRLTGEMTIWLTTVGRDDTPQPNPARTGSTASRDGRQTRKGPRAIRRPYRPRACSRFDWWAGSQYRP